MIDHPEKHHHPLRNVLVSWWISQYLPNHQMPYLAPPIVPHRVVHLPLSPKHRQIATLCTIEGGVLKIILNQLNTLQKVGYLEIEHELGVGMGNQSVSPPKPVENN